MSIDPPERAVDHITFEELQKRIEGLSVQERSDSLAGTVQALVILELTKALSHPQTPGIQHETIGDLAFSADKICLSKGHVLNVHPLEDVRVKPVSPERAPVPEGTAGDSIQKVRQKISGHQPDSVQHFHHCTFSGPVYFGNRGSSSEPQVPDSIELNAEVPIEHPPLTEQTILQREEYNPLDSIQGLNFEQLKKKGKELVAELCPRYIPELSNVPLIAKSTGLGAEINFGCHGFLFGRENTPSLLELRALVANLESLKHCLDIGMFQESNGMRFPIVPGSHWNFCRYVKNGSEEAIELCRETSEGNIEVLSRM